MWFGWHFLLKGAIRNKNCKNDVVLGAQDFCGTSLGVSMLVCWQLLFDRRISYQKFKVTFKITSSNNHLSPMSLGPRHELPILISATCTCSLYMLPIFLVGGGKTASCSALTDNECKWIKILELECLPETERPSPSSPGGRGKRRWKEHVCVRLCAHSVVCVCEDGGCLLLSRLASSRRSVKQSFLMKLYWWFERFA